jgi:serine/threonine protein kinase
MAPPSPLPVGTRLGAFEVRAVLGLGQYGYGYRVWDAENETEYAVKEYLPQGLARREGATQVLPRRPEDDEPFAQGLRAFLDEGKLLSRVRDPGLVAVYGSWEENGSAYMAMDLVPGRNLQQTMQARGRPPREPALRALLDPLLAAVQALHRAGVEHRDIGLSSIVIGPDHQPVLMDLGTPRRLAAARGDAGAAGPREGFAPPEMYASGKALERGPWTDVYALGAVLHCLMTGKPPAAAPQRGEGDAHGGREERVAPRRRDERAGNAARTVPLAWPASTLRRYSLEFLAVVEWMLAPRPQDRPRDIDAVRAALADPAQLPAHLRPGWRRRLAWRLREHRRTLGLVGSVLLLVLAAALLWGLRQAGWLPGLPLPG